MRDASSERLQSAVKHYRETLGHVPASLLTKAFALTKRNHKWPSLPSPGDVLEQIEHDLARIVFERMAARERYDEFLAKRRVAYVASLPYEQQADADRLRGLAENFVVRRLIGIVEPAIGSLRLSRGEMQDLLFTHGLRGGSVAVLRTMLPEDQVEAAATLIDLDNVIATYVAEADRVFQLPRTQGDVQREAVERAARTLPIVGRHVRFLSRRDWERAVIRDGLDGAVRKTLAKFDATADPDAIVAECREALEEEEARGGAG